MHHVASKRGDPPATADDEYRYESGDGAVAAGSSIASERPRDVSPDSSTVRMKSLSSAVDVLAD